MARADTRRAPAPRRHDAFTLVELLVVMAVAIILIGLATPVINALKNSGDVTSAAYDMNDALTRARTYALSSNTYVWVGFFEEDGSRSSASPALPGGTGRIILSTVFSKDGTCIYDPTTPGAIDATKLVQMGKLLKIDHAHLYTPTDGTNTGGGFAGRPNPGYPIISGYPPPANDPKNCRISDQYPADSNYTFSYPLGSSGSAAQYVFKKIVQFSPRGETRINCVQDLQPIIEIGLMRSNGSVPDTIGKNVVALQMTGIASNLTIYRP